MTITILVDVSNMMYRTFINGVLYDSRDGFKNVEDIISDASCAFLYDSKVDHSNGFKVEFVG